MKTLKTITPYAIPIALLMTSVAIATPPAHAERPGYKTFQVRFVFDPTDSAQEIYSDLNRTAQRACGNVGAKSIRLHYHVKVCKADVMDQAVQAIGRTDIAALHYGERMSRIASK
jgi:UrcA family protein